MTHDLIQIRPNLCTELTEARREAGLSEDALAQGLGVQREKLARLEAESGSVEFTQVPASIGQRLASRLVVGLRRVSFTSILIL